MLCAAMAMHVAIATFVRAKLRDLDDEPGQLYVEPIAENRFPRREGRYANTGTNEALAHRANAAVVARQGVRERYSLLQ